MSRSRANLIPGEVSQIDLMQQAFAARNILMPRSPGRKMSAEVTAYQPVISLPANADGWMQALLSGLSLKNELDYNRETWAGWIKTAGAVGDSTGLEFTADGTNYIYARLPVQLKPSTKYGLLLTVLSNTGAPLSLENYIVDSNTQIANSSIVGNVKAVFTTKASISSNILSLYVSSVIAAGLKIKIANNIRLYELPAGSQIETDFTNLTADQLALKYPYIQGGAARDVQSQRVQAVGRNLAGKTKVVGVKYNVGSIDPTTISAHSYDVNTGTISWTSVIGFAGIGVKFRAKPNQAYFASITPVTFTNKRNTINWYDSQGNYISSATNSGDGTYVAGTSPANASYGVLGFTSSVAGSYVIKDLMLTAGAVATAYEPYSDTTVYIPGPLRSLPNEVRDTATVRRVNVYAIQVSDIEIYTATSNVDYAIFKKPIDFVGYGNIDTLVYNAFALPGYINSTNGGIDSVDAVGKITHRGSTGMFSIGFAKDTTLTQMQAALAGTVIRYQLTTPVPTKYKDPGQLYAQPYGTIITEPCAHGTKLPAYGTGKIQVSTSDAPISSIESVYRIDTQADGSQIEVDVTSSFTLDADKLGITGTGTDPNKPYEYVCLIDPAYSTVPPITYSYPEADALALGVASHSYGSAAADWVLTTAESQCEILSVTNAGAAANIIAPAITRPYTVINGSGQAITIKVSGGTGVTIASGVTAMVAYINGAYIKLF